jgi:hypothetical protein
VRTNSDQKDSSDEEILRIARQRFDIAAEAESEIRTEALDDLKFSAGDQWPEEIKRQRQIESRPCLTINRMPQAIHQITNDQRQNRPAIQVSPVDDKADVETAKILQGMTRHIEYSSDADTAYDTAFDSSVRGGLGYFRIITDFCDPMSFDQDIRIKRIRNRFSVYLDPSYKNPDGSDANYGFVFEDLTEDEYKAQYPDKELPSLDDWASIGDQQNSWMDKGTVRVAEYFFKDFKQVTIVLLNTKEVVEKSKLPSELPEGVEIVAERKTLVPTVRWYKMNGIDVLEKTDWPGRWIPIIPVIGEELDIDGKRILKGIVRDAKDPQRMYNYMASNEAEAIALAPKAPWIGYEGQFEGHEDKWRTANTKNHPYLEVKGKMLGGNPAPLPQRNTAEPAVQAITQSRMMASDDLKATTGLYDAALGNQSNEKSGIAIQRRSNQSQVSNFHFIDNLHKSIRHAGRIIIDLIPHIYDTERAVRILGEDGTEEVVYVNKLFNHNGKDVTYDLSAGTYDVTIDSGPSFETKRQEAVQAMLDFTRAMPQQASVISDLLVRNMDWSGADEIADRLKKMLPPGIADDQKDGGQPLPQQVTAQMQQMQQMIDQLTQHLNEKTHQIETRSLELESKERIAMAGLQVEAEIALAKIGSSDSQALLKHQVAELSQRLEFLHQNIPFQIQNGSGPDGALQPQEQPQMMPPQSAQQMQQPQGAQAPGNMGV